MQYFSTILDSLLGDANKTGNLFVGENSQKFVLFRTPVMALGIHYGDSHLTPVMTHRLGSSFDFPGQDIIIHCPQ